ncbi:serine hydrolase [bacterium]|nr:serine hydrolase [bacterium]
MFILKSSFKSKLNYFSPFLLLLLSLLSINSEAQIQHKNSNAESFDSSRYLKLIESLNESDHKINSIMVVQNGTIEIEQYFNSKTEESLQDIRSVTKSITALLTGIAIDKGIIDNIDLRINSLLDISPTKNESPSKSNITIRHLLTMSTGWDCNDWDKRSKGQEDRMIKKKDLYQCILNLPMEAEPGDTSLYCSMAQILLKRIIEIQSGMSIDSFTKTHLFTPLGIQHYQWGHTQKKEVPSAAKRLYMKSTDLAKIGQLVLQKGRWNKEQIVSKAWIEEMLAPFSVIGGMKYGYYWWTVPLKNKDNIIECKVATGNGGQYIFVIEELKLVAVFTGSAYNSEEDKLPFLIMRDVKIPTFNSN